MSKLNLRGKFQGALLGTFVGDALGMPLEGWTPEEIAREYGPVRELVCDRLGKGTYTDDTQMMIAVAESLVRSQRVEPADLARSFLENYEPQRGYGPGTTQVIHAIEAGTNWQEASSHLFDGGSYGNGASMRIAPVGLLYHEDPDRLRQAAYDCSQVTHAHPLGKESAALQAFAVARALQENPRKGLDCGAFLDELRSFVHPDAVELRVNLEKVKTFLGAKPSINAVVRFLGNDVRAYTSVPASIYAFLANPNSFEEAVVFAVSLGGDTDTIAAMTGAIAGALHGIHALPQRWLLELENGPKGRDYVLDLACRLFETKPLA